MKTTLSPTNTREAGALRARASEKAAACCGVAGDGQVQNFGTNTVNA